MSESTTLIASRDLDGSDPLVIASLSYQGGVWLGDLDSNQD